MTKWFDLGVSHPLALGMAHPLADRLETLASPKVNKVWAKGATAAFVLGVATMSAPLTIAENHPENTLDDTVVTTNSNKSVIKIQKTDDDGNEIKKHYEIEINGDAFEAYEFDEDGNKRKVDPSEIEGFNIDDAKNSKSWAFSVGDDNELKFNSGKHITLGSKGEVRMLRFPELAKMENLKGLEGLKVLSNLEDLKALSDLEGLEASERLEIEKMLERVEDLDELKELESEHAKVFVWNDEMREPPEPPLPPRYRNEDGEVSVTRSFVFSDRKDFDGKAPMRFQFGDEEAFVMFKEGEHVADAKLAAAKSMLESVESMLTDVEGMEETTRELEKTRKELNKARKALEAAETRMQREAAEK